MRSHLKFLLSCFFAWIVLFVGARLVFVLYYWDRARGLGGATRARIFLYGLRMDASMAAYLLLPVTVFLLAGLFLRPFRHRRLYAIYTYVLLALFVLITIADLEVYRSWGFRLDATPLKYLSSPREAWASVSHLPLLLIFLALTVAVLALCYGFRRLVLRQLPLPAARRGPTALVLLAFGVFLILPLRGGWQLSPINQSSVYFSHDEFANVTAVNASWNFMNGLWMGRNQKNPYKDMALPEARAIVDSLLKTGGGGVDTVLSTQRPNVIIIIWESFTQKATETSINGQEVTPRFNQLKKEGIYFDHAYASGDRTDKGIAAVLSGYPALNNFSVIRDPAKSSKLPTLGAFFKERGYYNSFYYGGEPEFANIKSYILQGRVDAMVEKGDFKAADLNSKWGAHDGVVAKRLLNDLDSMRQPFFSTWLTLSSHEPFEAPVPPIFAGNDITTKFENTLHYTDEVLYDFVRSCASRPWWKNTVIVIVADHGHPLLEPSNAIDNFRIPLLWLGGALKRTGVVERIASQIDLATTLSMQAGGAPGRFPYSKNLFDSTAPEWAYYSFHSGFGLALPGRTFAYDNVGRQPIITRGQAGEKDLKTGQALQEAIYQNYLDK